MKIKEIKKLLKKFEAGETTQDEEQKLRSYFAQDKIPEELHSYADQFQYYREIKKQKFSYDFDPFAKIDFEEDKQAPAKKFIRWPQRVAAGFVLLLIGFSAGLLMNETQFQNKPTAFQNEIEIMKSALTYSPNRQATASERIYAVNISNKIPPSATFARDKITEVLIRTMNTDDNVNVRLAAAEALFRFRSEPRVQAALVKSLKLQQNPMMQITLINMLVKMKEKSAIGEMQQMLADTEVEPIVKERLELGINLLKANQLKMNT